MGLDREEQIRLSLAVSRAFSPAAPIDEKGLFAGRTAQLRQVIDTIHQRGQHAIIFGERGLGKTSLAKMLSSFLQTATVAPHVVCDGTDNYSTLWRKIFSEIEVSKRTGRARLRTEPANDFYGAADTLPAEITPDVVRRMLSTLGSQVLLVVIIDEFDRLADAGVRGLFADTIKMLSDYAVPATLVLVGVADTVDELIVEHQSVERALVQIRMPRMADEESEEVVRTGLARVGMAIDRDAVEHLAFLSQGFPHYTQLLALNSCREAIDSGDRRISLAHVDAAIVKTLALAQQTIRNAYHKATTAPRRESLHPQVLLAAALARSDELGYFSAAGAQPPMSLVMGREMPTRGFARHLAELCGPARGPVLMRAGAENGYRFRFVNALMQPFVIMQGFAGRLITRATLAPEGAGQGSYLDRDVA